jgi:spore coat protein U-like protein
MKKLLGMVMVLGLVLSTGVAFAADTNTLTVQASVVGTCKFSSGTSTLDFGALDPSSTSDGAATTTVNFWCTNKAGYTVAANNGAHFGSSSKRMQGPTAADLIPYALSYNPITGTGSGKTTPIVLSLTGSILNADYVNAAVGSYSDTVALSITP